MTRSFSSQQEIYLLILGIYLLILPFSWWSVWSWYLSKTVGWIHVPIFVMDICEWIGCLGHFDILIPGTLCRILELCWPRTCFGTTRWVGRVSDSLCLVGRVYSFLECVEIGLWVQWLTGSIRHSILSSKSCRQYPRCGVPWLSFQAHWLPSLIVQQTSQTSWRVHYVRWVTQVPLLPRLHIAPELTHFRIDPGALWYPFVHCLEWWDPLYM